MVTSWYSAGPWAKYDLEKTVVYMSVDVFTDAEGNLFYQTAPGDAVYFNTALESIERFCRSDNCYEFPTPGVKPFILVPVSGNVPLDGHTMIVV